MVGPCAHREDSGTPSSSLCPPPTTWVGSSSCLRGACWHGLSQLAWAVFHCLSQSQFILSLSSFGHMREPREDSNHKVTKPGCLCGVHGSLVFWGALHIGGLPLLWELGFLGCLWRFVSWAAWLPLGRWGPDQVWRSLLKSSVASRCSLHTHIPWSDFLKFPSLFPTMVLPGRWDHFPGLHWVFPPCPLGLGPLCAFLMIPATCGLLSSYPLVLKYAKLTYASGPLHLPSSRCPPDLVPHLLQFSGSMLPDPPP